MPGYDSHLFGALDFDVLPQDVDALVGFFTTGKLVLHLDNGTKLNLSDIWYVYIPLGALGKEVESLVLAARAARIATVDRPPRRTQPTGVDVPLDAPPVIDSSDQVVPF